MQQPDDPGVDQVGETTQTPWKVLAAIYGLTLSTAIVVATTAWGDPDNSLHTSAQAWGFSLIGVILGGVLANSFAVAFGWLRK